MKLRREREREERREKREERERTKRDIYVKRENNKKKKLSEIFCLFTPAN